MAARPDLSRRTLLVLLGTALCLALALLAAGDRPGAPLQQASAMLGGVLLLVPFAFSVAKRSGRATSPPTWFVVHVLMALVGTLLVALHVGGGDWISPPGLLLAALVFLVIQGTLARAFLDEPTAGLFASRLRSFQRQDRPSRPALAEIIEAKRRLLARLELDAEEGLFSPTPAHWLRSPRLTFAYAKLAARERREVGARRGAGLLLAQWRRVHIAVAWLFWAGLAAHVVLVIFFAGYVADGRPVDWWHVTAWGG